MANLSYNSPQTNTIYSFSYVCPPSLLASDGVRVPLTPTPQEVWGAPRGEGRGWERTATVSLYTHTQPTPAPSTSSPNGKWPDACSCQFEHRKYDIRPYPELRQHSKSFGPLFQMHAKCSNWDRICGISDNFSKFTIEFA